MAIHMSGMARIQSVMIDFFMEAREVEFELAWILLAAGPLWLKWP